MAALKTAGISVDPQQAYQALKTMGLGAGKDDESRGPFGFGGFNPFGGKKDGGEGEGEKK